MKKKLPFPAIFACPVLVTALLCFLASRLTHPNIFDSLSLGMAPLSLLVVASISFALGMIALHFAIPGHPLKRLLTEVLQNLKGFFAGFAFAGFVSLIVSGSVYAFGRCDAGLVDLIMLSIGIGLLAGASLFSWMMYQDIRGNYLWF